MMGIVFEALLSLFDSIVCIYFILRYNSASWKQKKLTLPAISVYFLFTLAADYLIPENAVLATTVLFIISLIYSIYVCQGHYVRAILAASIYKLSFILLSSLTFEVLSFFFTDFDQLLQGADSTGRYIYAVIHKTALFAILRFLITVPDKNSKLEKKNIFYALLISFITIIGLGTAMSFATSEEAETFGWPVIVITVAFVLINIIVYLLISQVQKLQKNKYELGLLQEKMRFDEARYNETSAIWDNIRKVQHDIKQHLTVISGQLDNGETENCKKYVHDLLPTVDRMRALIKSNNPILDYIINAKLCTLENTQIVISGSVGDLSDIREPDLACLMGNILDNAVEAVGKADEKRIELIFAMQNSNRVIICKNTIRESVLKNNTNLISTKLDREQHGFGHIIISKIVSDYGGIVDYFEDDDMFGVQVILPMPD